MGLADKIADLETRIPTVRSETALFVQMNGPNAVVMIGGNTLSISCQGWYPPAAGMSVQVEWRNGSPIVTGPARVLNPLGVITATGSPKATVTVEGVAYLLYLRDGYAPVLGDLVTVNWATGIIEGKISGQDTPEPEPVPSPTPTTVFSDLVVRAADSGRFQSSWWGNDPWASSSNDGIWVYQRRNMDALAGANVERVEIYLPLQSQVGNANIGLHAHENIPGGAPSIGSLVNLPLGSRSGWVRLPDAWGNWFRDNPGGVGVIAPGGGGYTRWTGTANDSLSGALRFAGTR